MTSISQQKPTTATAQQKADILAIQRAHHRNQLIQKAILTLVTVFIVGIFIFPIYWWVGASFKGFQYFFPDAATHYL